MPPASGLTPPITPSPAHMSSMSKSPRVRRWGSALLLLIVATFAGSAFVNNWATRMQGTVSVIVRGADNVRTLDSLDIAGGVLTPIAGIDPNSITTISARVFTFADGSIITLDKSGVVRRPKVGNPSVLIASPVAPLLKTPLSVLGAGERIAWMSPADGSIQVFQRSTRGAYLPAYLNTDLRPNSLGFTADGAFLVVAKLVGEKTDIYAIRLDKGTVSKVTTINGLASIVPTP